MADVQLSREKPHTWQVEHSDYTPTSSISPSSTPTTEANDDISTASESDLDTVQGSEADDSEDDGDDDRYSKKRHRRSPPPIFFGTPNKAEHEKRESYATQARSRRLLRKDSLELTRRKSGGFERAERSEKEDATSVYGLQALRAEEDDISAFALSEGFDDSRAGDERQLDAVEDCRSDNDFGCDSSSEISSEDGSASPGDRTVRMPDALRGLQIGSLEEQPPSTPTKQIIRPFISRPSLAVSEADSSPGIALALHSDSNSRPSPFFRPSPTSSSKIRHLASPAVSYVSPSYRPAFNTDDLELQKAQQFSHSISPKRSVLIESPSKVNQAISPAKLSPTKVVVRQTLSAWAHAKLKTPQSPEKKEWESKHAEAVSPIRPDIGISSLISSTRKETHTALPSNGGEKHRPSAALPIEATTNSTAERPAWKALPRDQTAEDQLNRPPSRIARPIPPSRLPKPVQKAATPTLTNGTALKRMVIQGPAPSFRRVVNTPSTSSLQPNAATSSLTIATSRPVHRLASSTLATGPFRAPVTNARPVNSTSRPTASFSSPAKVGPIKRSTTQTSSPLKRATTSSTPIIRDARLIAPARQVSKAPLERPSSASSKSSTSLRSVPTHLPSSSPASKPLQVTTAGVGAARRVVISQENAPAMEEHPQRRPHKIDRSQIDEKRGLRIKEIMMGKSPALQETHMRNADENAAPSGPTESEIEPSPATLIRNEMDTATIAEVENAPRPVRRKQELRDGVKASRPARSPSVLTSSSSSNAPGPIPLSKTELSRLTSSHTQRNELFISQLETIIVRRRGENRPCSPSSKIRKSVGGSCTNGATKEAAKSARQERARRRTPEAFEAEEESDEAMRHRMGAGEDDTYTSPPRISGCPEKRVRWHRSLFCGPNDVARPLVSTVEAAKVKGCLRNCSVELDPLGNVLEANKPWSPRMSRNKVTIYKIIYDDDEQ